MEKEKCMRKLINFDLDKAPHFCAGRLIPRLIIAILIGLVIGWLIDVVVLDAIPERGMEFKDFVILSGIFMLIIEGIIFIDFLLDKFVPFQPKRTRSLIQLFSGVLWMMLVSALVNLYYFPDFDSLPAEKAFVVSRIILLFLFLGVTIVFVFTLGIINHKTMAKFRDSIKEIEQLKQEKLLLDYQALQDQLNPHFLFNSLSVLISEIQYNPENAVKMTEQLSRVYRYVINSRNRMVTELKKELDFALSFFFLQKTRIGEGVELKIQIPEAMKSMKLPPLSLQTLIENAIKHNVAATNRPLVIEIYTENSWLVVKNNYQPKTTTYSTHTGLENLKKRYQLLGEEEIRIENNEKEFIVRIPLLN